MNDEQFDDLKQFVANTVGQAEARLSQRFDDVEGRLDRVEARMDGVETGLKELRKEVREGFAGAAEPIGALHTQVDNHEERISKLEQQAA